MAPVTRSMCVRARRATNSTATHARKSTRQSACVHKRTVSKKGRKHTKDSSSPSCSKNGNEEEEDDIFQADLLPEWVLVHIFSFLTVKEKCRLTR